MRPLAKAEVTPRAAAAPAGAGPLEQGREFIWTDADFSRVQALIYQHAGINLHDGKHAMVYSRLSRRLRETGHASFHEYLGWLEKHDGPEWQEFVWLAMQPKRAELHNERVKYRVFRI